MFLAVLGFAFVASLPVRSEHDCQHSSKRLLKSCIVAMSTLSASNALLRPVAFIKPDRQLTPIIIPEIGDIRIDGSLNFPSAFSGALFSYYKLSKQLGFTDIDAFDRSIDYYTRPEWLFDMDGTSQQLDRQFVDDAKELLQNRINQQVHHTAWLDSKKENELNKQRKKEVNGQGFKNEHSSLSPNELNKISNKAKHGGAEKAYDLALSPERIQELILSGVLEPSESTPTDKVATDPSQLDKMHDSMANDGSLDGITNEDGKLPTTSDRDEKTPDDSASTKSDK